MSNPPASQDAGPAGNLGFRRHKRGRLPTTGDPQMANLDEPTIDFLAPLDRIQPGRSPSNRTNLGGTHADS